MGNNLRKLREERGWTHDEAATAMGVSRGQFIKLERGERRLTENYIRQAAIAFNVPDATVLGDGRSVPVVGRVSAGGSIDTAWENHAEPLFEIELPFPLGEDAIGFEITGESMWPRYDEGDVIVVSRHGEPLEALLGFEAVVRTGDSDESGGRYFKRVIRAGTPGLFDLESYNAPPMRAQKVFWGAGLIARVPASRWKRINGKAVKAAVNKARKVRS